MSNQVPQHNFFLMIPAFVADDKDLDDATKMLFGRLVALSNREGYSWASDEYLAQICNCKDRVIRDRLTALEEKGYIKRETKKNGMSWDRKIYPDFNIKENLTKGMSVPDRKAQACRIERHVRAVDIYNGEIDKDPPPLVPPKKIDPPPKKESLRSEKSLRSDQGISLRSEEEDSSNLEFLEGTLLSPNDKKRLIKQFPKQEIERALKLAESQPIKKSLMGLLLQILRNPAAWEEKTGDQPVTINEQKALQYNQKLSKMFPEAAKKNTDLIKRGGILVILDGGWQQISLNAVDYKLDIERAIRQLK